MSQLEQYIIYLDHARGMFPKCVDRNLAKKNSESLTPYHKAPNRSLLSFGLDKPKGYDAKLRRKLHSRSIYTPVDTEAEIDGFQNSESPESMGLIFSFHIKLQRRMGMAIGNIVYTYHLGQLYNTIYT